ncbi:hypothetical protein [Pseudofrankia sp. BMG5.36]|uniref:hypothetical protein n=1 Tax=Pseudofrankia sp. BMG5.36 TaxID=1834512 RepID=UPI0010425389|nr:hypothetical protein [Pseudofrankia sp. BMG5.36]
MEPQAFEQTTVNGRPALLVSAAGQTAVYWVVDQPGWVTIRGLTPEQNVHRQIVDHTAVQVSGTDRASVLRIARSTTVGPKPQGPADLPAVLAGINAAGRAAFDGASGAGMLAAVTDPTLIRPALDRALAARPEQVRQIRLVTLYESLGDLVFLSDTELVATWVTVTRPGEQLHPNSRNAELRFVETADGWKVTRSSFCLVMMTTVPGCPRFP